MNINKASFRLRGIIAIAVAVCLSLVSCHKSIKKDIRNLKRQVNALTEQINSMNQSVASLNDIITSIQGGVSITSLTEQKEGDVVTGYVIVFSDGHVGVIPVSDIQIPTIGVAQDTDGNWYWTWNGDWILFPDGSKVQSGKDGITPRLDSHDGWWWVSYDKGVTWTKLDEAPDAGSASSVFTNVNVSGTDIVFTLTDGSEIRVPRSPNIGIAFSVPDSTYINPGETINIDWTLSGELSESIRVTASSDGNYVVKVTATSATAGILSVSCPKAYADGYINVMVTDGKGYTLVKVINFFQREITLPGDNGITGAGAALLTYSVPCTGGTVTIPWSGNYEVVLNIRNGASSWITGTVTTRATINGDIVLTIAENTGSAIRTGLVDICPANNPSYVIRTVEVVQASAYFTIDRPRINAPSSGGTYTVNMTSSRGLLVQPSVSGAAAWFSQNTVQDGTSYTMTLTVTANGSGAARTATIALKSDDGGTTLGEILIYQLDASHDNSLDMVIEVSANVANDYQVYLPLYGAVDCYIDWGDGTFDIVKKTIKNADWVSHTYSGLNDPTLFDVRVSGQVASLRAYTGSYPTESGKAMPSLLSLRSVKQWGSLGVTSMSMAFCNAALLSSIPDDTIGAFSNVNGFEAAFYGCSALQSIPANLFKYCSNCTSFHGVFRGCSSISAIPHGLFDNCQKASSFAVVFSNCQAITSIPDGLFDNCTKAENFSSVFYNCNLIESIPVGLFDNCPEVTNFTSAFYSCTSLTSIPGALFSHNTKVTNFTRTFANCTSILSIPNGLFDNNPLVESFEGTFFHLNLITSIPAGLFANCTKVIRFGPLSKYNDDANGVFQGCASLQSIPDELFVNCHNAESFNSAFYGCAALFRIPVGLFDSCRKVSYFSYAFSGCGHLEWESPYTVVNSSKVHLYERENYPDYFVKPTNNEKCFYGCGGLTDYLSIPSGWK